MSEKIINIIFIVAFAYPALKFFHRYIIQLIFSLLKKKKFDWNKDVDKPRLLFYLAFTILSIFIWYLLIFQPIDFNGKWKYISDIAQSLLIVGSVYVSKILCDTWTKHFEEVSIPKVKEVVKEVKTRIFKESIECAIKDIQSIETISKSLIKDNLINGDLASFKALCLNTDIEKENRLKWNDTVNNDTNKQSLVQLLSNIYTNTEILSNKTIALQMEKYFLDNNGKELFKNINDRKNIGKVVSVWRNSKTKYKDKIDLHFDCLTV